MYLFLFVLGAVLLASASLASALLIGRAVLECQLVDLPAASSDAVHGRS